MTKQNIMFGVAGLFLGLIIGFFFANSVNRTTPAPAGSGTQAASTTTDGQALPPDHPPIDPAGGQPQVSGPRPEVTAAIDKARKEPRNFEAQMTAADLYYQIKRFDEAAKFYETAAALKPTDTEPLIKAGNAYFDGEKYEQAEKWYLQVLEKDPKNISVRTDLGLTFFLRSPADIDRAIKEYKTSLAIDPNHEITLQNMVLAYKEKGDTTELRGTLEKLKKVNPNNPVVLKDGQ